MMFTVSFALAFIGCGVWLHLYKKSMVRKKVHGWHIEGRHPQYRESVGRRECATFFVAALPIAALLLTVVTALAGYTNQVKHSTEVRKLNKQISLYGERRDNLLSVVKAELAKYPEYEKQILGNINPQILLSFPVLKSNETIVKTVELIVTLETGVYTIRDNLISVQRAMYAREISPWTLFVPTYQHLLGTPNPVSQ